MPELTRLDRERAARRELARGERAALDAADELLRAASAYVDPPDVQVCPTLVPGLARVATALRPTWDKLRLALIAEATARTSLRAIERES